MQDPADHAFLSEFLRALDNARRELAAILDAVEKRVDIAALRQRRGKRVRGRHCVLNCKVDPDPADRRHGVGRVADRKQPGTMPGREPVEFDGEQMKVADSVVINRGQSAQWSTFLQVTLQRFR